MEYDKINNLLLSEDNESEVSKANRANFLIAFFDLPIKTEEEAYEKILDISRNNEYMTGNLSDYDYLKKHYKLIAIDLSKQQVLQENEDLIQQISFIGKLEEAANVFIIIEKKENTILEFSQNLANVICR